MMDKHSYKTVATEYGYGNLYLLNKKAFFFTKTVHRKCKQVYGFYYPVTVNDATFSNVDRHLEIVLWSIRCNHFCNKYFIDLPHSLRAHDF